MRAEHDRRTLTATYRIQLHPGFDFDAAADQAAYLADRIVALVGEPASVGMTVEVEKPQPRRRNDPAVMEAVGKLRGELSAAAAAL